MYLFVEIGDGVRGCVMESHFLHMDGNPVTQMYLRYMLFVYLLTTTSFYAYSTLSGYREIYRIRSYTA